MTDITHRDIDLQARNDQSVTAAILGIIAALVLAFGLFPGVFFGAL